MIRFVLVRALPLLLALLMIGCGGEERNAPSVSGQSQEPKSEAPVATEERPVILFLGTSLTAGPGIAPEQAYPALIQAKVDSAGLPYRVVNAGVSGETSAGALRRLDWLLRQPFHVLVLETGANDMLRGTDVDSTRANIRAIVDRVRRERPEARIVLAGMLAAPNLGRDYGTRFREIFSTLAEERDLPLIPFLLQDVAAVPELNLGDGIHPNPQGHRVVAGNVWKVLEPLLREEVAGE